MKRERFPVNLTDGKTAWLTRLSPQAIIELSDSIWHAQRKRMIESFKDADIDSKDRISVLCDMDRERGLFSKLLTHAITMEGAQEIITKASESPYAENASNLLEQSGESPEKMVEIACALLGHKFDEEEAIPEKKRKKS